MNQGNDILCALDAFIRKYYKSLLIRGILYSVGIVTLLFLAVILLEHFGWLSSILRGIIFWGGLAIVLAVVAWFVVRPLLKMHGLGKRISREDAARIIGRHFPEISDKLLNLLQLQQNSEQNDLLVAAIEQKTTLIRPIPILSAIDLKINRRYLRYALPPLVILLVLFIISPRLVTEPSKRIVHYQTKFERPAPFSFKIENEELKVSQGEDFDLRVITEGEAIPDQVHIIVDGRSIRMSKSQSNEFDYIFRQVNRSHDFYFEAAGVVSDCFRLEVLPNPSVLSFTMLLSYPAYTGLRSETLVNVGDAAVPEGTIVRWNFQTQDADNILFFRDSTLGSSTSIGKDGRIALSHCAMQTMEYGFAVVNGYNNSDTLQYVLSAIVDAAPMILVDEMIDSAYPDRRLFQGSIKDDYGFSKLVFCHKVNSSLGEKDSLRTALLAVKTDVTMQKFYFTFNTAELTLNPGDRLTYYFEVYDNDAIHGSKKARSRQFEIKIPSVDELDQIIDKNQSEVRQSAENQMSDLKKLQQKIDEMMRRLVDKKELNWQDKKDLQQIHEKQQQVHRMMQEMQRQIQENNRLEQKYREQSEQLMEKQRELDRLMNEVMDETMKETMKKIEQMMKELDKNKVQQELEQLKLDNSNLEKQLDQNIELLKRLEVEKKVEETINKLDKLTEEQMRLADSTKNSRRSNEKLNDKQQNLNDRFQQLENDMKQIREDYKKLDPSTNFKIPKETQKQVEQHLQEAIKNIQKGKNAKASEHQKQAVEQMQKMSEELAEAQMDVEQQDLAEDAELVRLLLKSLVRLSFNQEGLISQVNKTFIQDPRYQSIIASQNRLNDDFRNVEDSLRSMAKRQIQVAAAINSQLGTLNSQLSQSLYGLINMNQSFYSNSRNTMVARPMQYSMTSLNNLALILAESLDMMQNQMRQNAQKKSNGQCKNPGKNTTQCKNPGKNPSPKSMSQMQQELNRQMEALKKQLDKQGKQQDGRHQLGQQTMSKEFARMAAQQEMIRRMMQEYSQEMKQQGGGDAKLAKEIDQMMRQMEQTEIDLVNRTITNQTIMRQQQIMTRLLQHEKAEMQREKEEHRESHEAMELYSQPSPAELEKFKRLQKSTSDQFRTVPPVLSPYYREKVNDYFFNNK